MMASPVPIPQLAGQLDAWLPQTQCTQCGFPHCRAYAEALARGAAGINRCPPGGDVTIAALAGLLAIGAKPLDPRFGAHRARERALIDEAVCIGCRKCLDVCPVDAIVGARKLMHTVLARDCTGCGLCVPVCPVDCIAMNPVAAPAGHGRWPEYAEEESERWRRLAERRRRRLARHRAERTRQSIFPPAETIRAEIAAALARVRARRPPRA
jgi:electron transport complex protein RnfB